jgi:hypothetical protein
MFKMANGGYIPPPVEADMEADAAIMSPEQEAYIFQEAQDLPPEVIQAAESGIQDVEKDLTDEALASAVNEEVSRSISNLGMAGDFKDVMNVVWDEDEGLDTYRSRLADIVGPEDAQRTPDSVLALVQPTLQLAQLDQGIGALMQGELEGSGDLGGGITELTAKSAVVDGMAAETSALVKTVGSMAQGPSGMDPMMQQGMDPMMQQGMDPMMQQGMAPEPSGIMATGEDPMGMDPRMIQAMLQGAGPMGQGMV